MNKVIQHTCERCGRSSGDAGPVSIINIGTAEHPRYCCSICHYRYRHQIDGTDILSSKLKQKGIGDFTHQQEKDGVRLGFDYYYYHYSTREITIAVIEFGILNETSQAIEVLPTDFAFTYGGRPVRSARLEFDAAAARLVDRGFSAMDWLGISGGPAAPHEVVLLLPLLFVGAIGRSGLYLKDFVAWQRRKRALREISFDYETVKPGKFKHGLIFFQVTPPAEQDVTWPENWNLSIDVLSHHIEPQVSQVAITYKHVAYLPNAGCSVLILAIQFACIFVCILAGLAGISLLTGGTVSFAVPLICGVTYLAIAALVMLALTID